MSQRMHLTNAETLFGFPGKAKDNAGTLSILNLALRQYFDQRGVLPWSVMLSNVRCETLSRDELVLQDGRRLQINWSEHLTPNRIICRGDPSIEVKISSQERNRLVMVTQRDTQKTLYYPQHLFHDGHWDPIRNYHSHNAIATESEEEAHVVLERFQRNGWVRWCLTHYRELGEEGHKTKG